jgi:hypothetical protein
MIGAERDLVDRKLVRYTPEVVVAIPSEEARRYAREYRRAITDGSLKIRTAAEWSAANAPAAPPEPEPEPPAPGDEPEPEEPAPAPEPEPEPEPLTTRKSYSTRQARLSQPVTADEPPDKDEAPDANYESRR